MRRFYKFSLLAVLALALLGTRPAATQGKVHETVLHNFQSNSQQDGLHPYASLISDAAGNLYGTTFEGGSAGYGTVFELSPQSGGGWIETVLYNFGEGNDGRLPYADLVLDSAGNLYGTTFYGGNDSCDYGCGTVFELSPQSNGGWSETVLYSFEHNGVDGNNPHAGLIFDNAGNLYGTTVGGSTFGAGTVFELSPQPGGGWSEGGLYAFQEGGADGSNPYAGVILDSAGNLYGTTLEGGSAGHGTVFELSPKKGGGWSETVLYAFDGYPHDGFGPVAGLVFDTSGNLYGTTSGGGNSGCTSDAGNGCGTVFELSPNSGSGGGWSETLLHSFQDDGRDGTYPDAGLIFDANGNLYGTTTQGGGYKCRGVSGCGSVFALLRKSDWAEKVFSFNGSHGGVPGAGLIFDTRGNLYGTTDIGGTGGCNIGGEGCGTVFEITP